MKDRGRRFWRASMARASGRSWRRGSRPVGAPRGAVRIVRSVFRVPALVTPREGAPRATRRWRLAEGWAKRRVGEEARSSRDFWRGADPARAARATRAETRAIGSSLTSRSPSNAPVDFGPPRALAPHLAPGLVDPSLAPPGPPPALAPRLTRAPACSRRPPPTSPPRDSARVAATHVARHVVDAIPRVVLHPRFRVNAPGRSRGCGNLAARGRARVRAGKDAHWSMSPAGIGESMASRLDYRVPIYINLTAGTDARPAGRSAKPRQPRAGAGRGALVRARVRARPPRTIARPPRANQPLATRGDDADASAA